MGHMAAHNGVGAVMGSKKLKAIVVDRGKDAVPLKDKEALSQVAKEIRAGQWVFGSIHKALGIRWYYLAWCCKSIGLPSYS